MKRFPRIERLPPYVFNITAELKMAARHRGEDIIDMSMGNPDGPTPPHIVEKLVEAASRPTTHGYSVSKGIPRLRNRNTPDTVGALKHSFAVKTIQSDGHLPWQTCI
jgi:alanine-synthesizing transaminase